jgi:hypothetical protein
MIYHCDQCHHDYNIDNVSQLCILCNEPMCLDRFITVYTQETDVSDIRHFVRQYAILIFSGFSDCEISEKNYCFVGQTSSKLAYALKDKLDELPGEVKLIIGREARCV